MRKGSFRLTAALAAVSVLCQAAPLVSLAAYRQEVDTITLETEAEDVDDVAVDIGWKTEQDNGKWINDMSIGDDVTSLILIVNNLDKGTDEALPDKETLDANQKTRPRRRHVTGNSRLYYMSRNAKGDWKQVFTINCVVSGGPDDDESIYGAYRAESAFGSKENPGSLLPYRKITDDDYWITDPESEDYMTIVTSKEKLDTREAVNLEYMKAYSNYGMILRPEDDAYPALIINCQQADTVDRTVSGVQLAESYVRMLIQGIDENTRIMIAGEIEDFEGM